MTLIYGLLISFYAWAALFTSYWLWSPWPIMCAAATCAFFFIANFVWSDDEDA